MAVLSWSFSVVFLLLCTAHFDLAFNMHDLIDPWPVISKTLKKTRSDTNNDTNHPLNLCKTSWNEKDIGNLMPAMLFSRQKGVRQAFAKHILYCPFISSQRRKQRHHLSWGWKAARYLKTSSFIFSKENWN